MFLTSPFIDQVITRFDRWTLSEMAITPIDNGLTAADTATPSIRAEKRRAA